MNERVEILWGNFPEEGKQEFRKHLREAMRSIGLMPHWKEFSGKNWLASPDLGIRVSVNGRRICKTAAMGPVPGPAELAEKMGQRGNFRYISDNWFHLRASAPALLLALFPKCPICWATYASLLTYIGISIPYYSWLIWAFAGCGAVSVALGIRRAARTHEYYPLAFQLTGYALVFVNRLYWNQAYVVYLAMVLLIISSFFLDIKRKTLLPL